ncbi:hypothetical protein ACIA7R_28830 [Micromonospora chalcea]
MVVLGTLLIGAGMLLTEAIDEWAGGKLAHPLLPLRGWSGLPRHEALEPIGG